MPAAWSAIFLCYQCEGRITLANLALDRITVVSMITPCPHCGAKPHIASEPSSVERSKMHQLFYIAPTEARYRKLNDGDTWHFSQLCTQWPFDDFIELEMPPSFGALCNECRALRSKNQ